MGTMTTAQLHDARMLIPGAFEPNAPPHRATRAAILAPPASFQGVDPHSASATTPYLVDAARHPTTRLGQAAAILGDVGLIIGVVVCVVLVPGLVVQGLIAAVRLVLATFGR
jgi:hypothetical protein